MLAENAPAASVITNVIRSVEFSENANPADPVRSHTSHPAYSPPTPDPSVEDWSTAEAIVPVVSMLYTLTSVFVAISTNTRK